MTFVRRQGRRRCDRSGEGGAIVYFEVGKRQAQGLVEKADAHKARAQRPRVTQDGTVDAVIQPSFGAMACRKCRAAADLGATFAEPRAQAGAPDTSGAADYDDDVFAAGELVPFAA